MIATYDRRARGNFTSPRDQSNYILGNPNGPKLAKVNCSHGIGINKRIVKLL